jgi:histidine triad (HIT) family protein
MRCEYCDLQNIKENVLYEDNEVVVAVKKIGFAIGQVTVFPKEHLTILEMVNDDLLEKCSLVANKVGVAVFEALGVQGTNILIQNGLGAGQSVPHFSIEIIPRKENDGLNLHWTPGQVAEVDIETTLSLLKEEESKLKKETKSEEVKDDASENKPELDKNNPMIKSVRRIP